MNLHGCKLETCPVEGGDLEKTKRMVSHPLRYRGSFTENEVHHKVSKSNVAK